MKIHGEFGVIVGAVIIWLRALESLAECALGLAGGLWGWAAWNALLVLSFGLIGKKVWDAR